MHNRPMSTIKLDHRSLRDLAQSKMPAAVFSQCRIRARNDVEAIERWLDEYFDTPATFRTYKREAERFLVWCAQARKTNFASLDRDDVLAYIEFLKEPQPREVWCGPRRKKQGPIDTTWYPFAGPLSESAITTALASLNSLMSFLVDALYIEANPFALVRRKSRFKKNVDEQRISVHERILSDEEWKAIIDAIDDEPNGDELQRFKQERARFLITILFFLGLRIDELAHATWANIKRQNGRFWFHVAGKGGRLGKVPINKELVLAMTNYRHRLGMSPVPDAQEASPLIFSCNNRNRALSVRQMSNIVKELAIKAAHKFDAASLSHKRLLRFSPHWLRHLSASRQDLAGISFTNIKSNLRHQNEQTTRIYVHAYDDDRHDEMEKLTIIPSKGH